MKKKIQMLCLLAILSVAGIVLIFENNKTVWLRFNEDGELFLQVNYNQHEQNLYLWKDKRNESDRKYFFLPSWVKGEKIYYRALGQSDIFIDGKKLSDSGYFCWEEGRSYLVETGEDREQRESNRYHLIIMRSENLPSIFISTESGKMDAIYENKEYGEPGTIDVIEGNGTSEYRGRLNQISGRGNSTWQMYAKKSYSFSLEHVRSLCGLKSGKKWRLLALAREGTKLQTKIAMDIGEALELPYSPQGIWADLYLNGVYAGLYLLCEAVAEGEGRVEISDSGYLLERDAIYYEERPYSFFTKKGEPFVVRAPEIVTDAQLQRIGGDIQEIEDMMNYSIEEYADYIDRDSFAGKFLVDEISLNYDAYVTSCYFFKGRDGRLYAGPLWDYDTSMGIAWTNRDSLIIENLRPDGLDWFARLYSVPDFYESVRNQYEKLLPVMEMLLKTDIDAYAEWIRKSESMDEIRWPGEGYDKELPAHWGHYTTFESNVKYLKFFLANRLNALNRKWGISGYDFSIPSDGTVHEVVFIRDGKVVEKQSVPDGEFPQNIPQLDGTAYAGWYFPYGYRKKYTGQLPIFEDVAFVAE